VALAKHIIIYHLRKKDNSNIERSKHLGGGDGSTEDITPEREREKERTRKYVKNEPK
jgi:hypothetical protein